MHLRARDAFRCVPIETPSSRNPPPNAKYAAANPRDIATLKNKRQELPKSQESCQPCPARFAVKHVWLVVVTSSQRSTKALRSRHLDVVLELPMLPRLVIPNVDRGGFRQGIEDGVELRLL